MVAVGFGSDGSGGSNSGCRCHPVCAEATVGVVLEVTQLTPASELTPIGYPSVQHGVDVGSIEQIQNIPEKVWKLSIVRFTV